MSDNKISYEQIANPKSHYGNARASTRHFITQRVTGAVNIVLLALTLFIMVQLAGEDRSDVVELIGAWYIGLPLAVLIAVAAIHMRNGMRDTLEDYMHGKTYYLAMLLNTLFCLLLGALGIIAVLKLVFWG